jgi:hypothetical protein
MKSNLLYLHNGTDEAHSPSKRDAELLSRRKFIRRSSLFLPLSFFAGSTLKTAATSTIINRTIAAAPQNAISMANATWARPVTIPATWNKIRIGCRMHMTSTGANLLSNPIFAMGFNSGTAEQYGDATCLNFLGIAHDTATWSYVATGTSWYTLLAASIVARKRIGTTNTDGALFADGALPALPGGAATNSADRFMLFLDITKGSPNYTMHMPFRWADQIQGQVADCSSAQFLFYMGQLTPDPTAINGYQIHDGTNWDASPTIAFSESINPLNAINLYWNRADATLEICDIAVAVLA